MADTSKVFSVGNLIALAIVVLLAVAAIRTFVFEAFFVQGDSMLPTISSGELVLVDRMAYWRARPQRGDIIVAVPRTFPGQVVKRVIGMPGEWFSIENGQVVIRDSRMAQGVNLDEKYLASSSTPEVGTTYRNIDPEEYFALGDNRTVSIDSRELGPIDLWSIKGKVIGVFDFKTFKYKAF